VAPDGREAALKRLKPALAQREDLRERLRGELTLLETIGSAALVTPLGLVEDRDGPGLILEYLPNGDLVSLLGAPVRNWLPALRTVLAALVDLHAHGLAHGDLKARNVLFARDQSARVVDLLAARPLDAPAARSTAAYGLPATMQATARAADCFAFAVLIHELATARLPYGENGGTDLGASEPVKRSLEPAAAQLVAAAQPMLTSGGGLPQGLSYFADVIESVSAAGA
jgi:serine/threonine protein kinase